ncbi:MAG TPA: ribosome-associated translation inhibitor RaiA [bacterium]|nr:ribosome-associated translation inhibitor RaiA [bacterium]
MKVHITSRHQKLTEGLSTHIEEKIQRVERYVGKIKEAHVVLNFEKKVHLCEITLTAKNLKLSAKASSHDMYTSIDAAAQRLEKQAHKSKDKRVDRYRVETPKARASAIRSGMSEGRESEGPRVVRSETYAVKPMTIEEAALQLSSSKDEFLVFSNAETERTSVVYKRKDRNIGLIEPEY